MDVSKHVQKAEEAVKKKQFKYAIGLYHQVLAFKPDHGEARLGLRKALARQAEYKPTPAALAVLAGLPHLLSIVMARAGKKADALARACEKYLVLRPADERTNLMLGDALVAGGHLKSAAAVYEHFGEWQKSAEAFRRAGSVHYNLKDLTSALRCLEQGLKINPRDAEAERLRKNVAAEGTLVASRLGQAESSRDLMRDKEEQKRLERTQRLHRTDAELTQEIADLEAKYQTNSADARVRRELIDLYARAGQYEKALSVVEASLRAEPGSSDLKDRAGELKIAVFDREISKLKERVAKDQNASAADDLRDLERERKAFELDEYQRRVRERPTELELWYELGVRLADVGKTDGAIEAFQHSIKDPKKRLDSLVRLGSCFVQKGLFDLAKKQFTTALQGMNSTSERQKEVLYELGSIAEMSGQKGEAVSWFGKIYEVDIGYRDVAKKIDQLKS